jgi:hypothetical protein
MPQSQSVRQKERKLETKQQIAVVKAGMKQSIVQVPTELRDIVSQYVMALLNPKKYIGRYPDSYPRKTGVFRSIAEYFVPLRFGSGSVARFSLCARPIMGSLAGINQYQLAMANVDTDQWVNADWTSPTSYSGPIGGVDPRLDVNSSFMTSPPAGFYYAEFSNLNPAVDGSSVVYSGGLTPGAYNNGISVHVITNQFLRLPAGFWLVTWEFTLGLSNTAAATYAVVPYQTGAPNPAIMTGTTNDLMNQGTIATQVGENIVSVARSFIVSSAGLANVAGATVVRNGGPGVIGAGILSGFDGSVTISPINPSSLSLQANAIGYGLVEEIRPVGQSVLVSYMGTELVNGGTIASCYVPDNLVRADYFNNSEQAEGQLQYVEALMKLDGSYNGPLKDGTYAWWSPYDDTDSNFRTVSAMNQAQFPAIIVSGIFNPSTVIASGSSQLMMRVELCTTYEFITKATCFDLEHCIGSQQHIDAANNSISQQPHCMPNGKHLEFLKRMVGAIGDFARKNQSWLVPLGKTLASAIAI